MEQRKIELDRQLQAWEDSLDRQLQAWEDSVGGDESSDEPPPPIDPNTQRQEQDPYNKQGGGTDPPYDGGYFGAYGAYPPPPFGYGPPPGHPQHAPLSPPPPPPPPLPYGNSPHYPYTEGVGGSDTQYWMRLLDKKEEELRQVREKLDIAQATIQTQHIELRQVREKLDIAQATIQTQSIEIAQTRSKLHQMPLDHENEKQILKLDIAQATIQTQSIEIAQTRNHRQHHQTANRRIKDGSSNMTMTVIPAQTTEMSSPTTKETTAQITELTARTTTTTTTTATATTEETKNYNDDSCDDDDDDDECQQWLSKIESNPMDLQNAPYRIRNNKNIVMKAAKKNWRVLEFTTPELRNDKEVIMTAIKNARTGRALRFVYSPLEFVSPELRNDKEVIMASVQKIGRALKFASPSLQNDKEVMTAIQNDNVYSPLSPLEFASPELRNDKEVIMASVQKIGRALQFASPSLQNNKRVVMTAIQSKDFPGRAFQYASPSLRNDKDVTMAAVKKYGKALEFASPELRQDRDVVSVAVEENVDALRFALPEIKDKDSLRAIKDRDYILQIVQTYGCSFLEFVSPELLHNDKDLALLYVKSNPDNIKFLNNDLKRDHDILIVAGMYDESHDDAKTRQQQQQVKKKKKKIVLSTRFALHATSESAATTFTKFLKDHEYIRNGNFIIYSPNAFDKKTCDPNWTDINHPCRGTSDTCLYKNVLTEDGYPTDDCCWRYSFRNQLEEAKESGGFILQLVEREHGSAHDTTPKLGKGQEIELEMSKKLKLKVFHIYVPRMGLSKNYVDTVVTEIQSWYDDDKCQDNMSEVVLYRGYRNIESYF